MSSVYIHIPFCKTICSYCDFPKYFYNKSVDSYLDSLENEIKGNYKNEIIKTLYIGGGTPSCLNEDELNKLFNIIKIFKLSKDCEITFECNIESITLSKLKILKENKVNRLSIGIQTLNEKHLKFLNRNHTKEQVKNNIEMCKKMGFSNINVDLIYAINNQTIEELKEDLEFILKLDVNHISTYSLIIEPHTKLYIDKIKNIDEELDYQMYELICKILKENNFIHYEISNFCKKGYESKHNLVYWNNQNYYGFGAGASGYIDNIRYDNNRSLKDYINKNYILDKHLLNKNETIENEFILGLRLINGINKSNFLKKYNLDINNIKVVKELLEEGNLIQDQEKIYIPLNKIYISNSILYRFIGEKYE